MAPLREISGNARPNTELNAYQRGIIIGARGEGASYGRIEKTYQIHRDTARSTVHSASVRINGESLPRSGRPKKYTERDERHVIYYARHNPKAKYRQIQNDLNLDLSPRTFNRILQQCHIQNWISKKRPALRSEHARARYRWAKIHV